MNPIDQLTSLFKKFPGIGERQAKRFVYHLLRQDQGTKEMLIRAITTLQNEVRECQACARFHSERNAICSYCVNPEEKSTLLVVEKDTDLDSIHRSKQYHGYYFVLGGSIPVLEKDPASIVRLNRLLTYIKTLQPMEIILAFSYTPSGVHTDEVVRRAIHTIYSDISIVSLGRGLSTGTELEYSDIDTISNALQNRQ